MPRVAHSVIATSLRLPQLANALMDLSLTTVLIFSLKDVTDRKRSTAASKVISLPYLG
jgi:hypothetical protein